MGTEHLNGLRTGRPKGAKTNPANSTALVQALAIQRRMATLALREDTKPAISAALARSWCLVDQRLAAHRMKPLPKSVDVTKYHAARAAARKQGKEKHAQPSEPTETPKESLSQPDRHPGGGGEGGKAGGAVNENPT